MKKLLSLALLALSLSCVSPLFAQGHFGPGYGYGYGFGPRRDANMPTFIRGSVFLSPDEEGGKESPGFGVVVTVITSKSDTIYTSVGEKGTFRITGLTPGKAYVKFSMLGYDEEAKYVELVNGENKVLAYLKPSKLELEGAVVKESVDPVSIKEDTIVFHAASVKVNKGEMAIDILEQMPGVEVTDDGVSVLNEGISNVYIDGVLLFGNSPMRALNNLSASEVVDIKSFQEYGNKDPYHKISKTEQKERVLDIRTKSKPKAVMTGDFIAGGGFDTDTTYHKFRYTFGGDVNRFSETLQTHINYNINNINNASNRNRGNSFRSASGGGSADLRNLQFSANVNRKWMDPNVRNHVLGSVGASYSLSDRYDVSESIRQQIYFPDEKWDEREVNRTSHSETTNKNHSFSVNGRKALHDGSINANASYSISQSLSSSLSSNYNRQDDLTPQGTSSSSDRTSDSHSYNTSLSFRKGFQNKLRLSMSAGLSGSDSEGNTAKIDTTTSTITYKVLDIGTNGNSHSFNVGPSVRYEIDDYRAVSASYSYNNTYRQSVQLAMDISDPDYAYTDTVNTHTYTTDNNVHSASANYNRYFESIKGNLDLGVGYSSTGLNRDEKFPEADFYDRRFNSFRTNVAFRTESMLNRWNISYSYGNSTPSLEQVRPKLNNSNLYSVSSGNPLLKQSRTHNANLSYGTVLGAASREAVSAMESEDDPMVRRRMENPTGKLSTFSVSASFSMTQDPIVNRRIYYAESTYLPEYDYTMPAQSTFSSYENVGNSYSANFSIRAGLPIFDNRWMVSPSASMSWDDTPSYVDYTLTRTRNFRPSVRLGVRSNFSRNVRINLNANGSYIYSNNSLKDATSYFVERINLGVEVNNIFQHIYLGGNYNKSFTQGLSYGKLDDNIMNVNAGFRCGPKNNCDLSLAIYDLFNNKTGFSTSMSSNYITNSWNHTFGRYVLLTFAYRFNTMRGGRMR